jgi:hypothetical protein
MLLFLLTELSPSSFGELLSAYKAESIKYKKKGMLTA